MTPAGHRWFPTTPSRVQMAVWDGGGSEWSGGKIPWNGQNAFEALYEYVEIKCYDRWNRPTKRQRFIES
jgi:hypothetical protein